MPTFITRIELQSASLKDYQTLEAEMKKVPLKEIRKVGAGKLKTPSPVEFNFNGNFTLLQVTHEAGKAARKTGRAYRFTVIRERKLSMH